MFLLYPAQIHNGTPKRAIGVGEIVSAPKPASGTSDHFVRKIQSNRSASWRPLLKRPAWTVLLKIIERQLSLASFAHLTIQPDYPRLEIVDGS